MGAKEAVIAKLIKPSLSIPFCRTSLLRPKVKMLPASHRGLSLIWQAKLYSRNSLLRVANASRQVLKECPSQAKSTSSFSQYTKT